MTTSNPTRLLLVVAGLAAAALALVFVVRPLVLDDDEPSATPVTPAKVAGGSVAVAIVAVLVSRLIGIDITGLLGGGGGGGKAAPQQGSAAPPTGPDPDAELVDDADEERDRVVR